MKLTRSSAENSDRPGVVRNAERRRRFGAALTMMRVSGEPTVSSNQPTPRLSLTPPSANKRPDKRQPRGRDSRGSNEGSLSAMGNFGIQTGGKASGKAAEARMARSVVSPPAAKSATSDGVSMASRDR